MIFLGQFYFFGTIAKLVHLVGSYIDLKILDAPIIVSDFIIEEVGKWEINGHKKINLTNISP